MTECSTRLALSPLSKNGTKGSIDRPVVVANDGGAITSDAGVLLLREVDRRVGLTRRLAECLTDLREQGKVDHSLLEILAQRVFQIAQGYEDCNDANFLRKDPAFKVAVGRDPAGPDLSSQSTLTRLENAVTREECYRLSEALFAFYRDRHRSHPPSRIIIDVDTTDDLTHGQQQYSLFNTHYGGHCFLPMLIFAQHIEGGPQYLLAAVLRPGKAPTGRSSMSILKRMITRLRRAFPKCRIEVRADGGFAAPEVYAGCRALKVGFTIALPKNTRLSELAAPLLEEAKALFLQTGETVRLYGEVPYQARTWSAPQRVVVKAEVTSQGPNPRYVTTSRADTPKHLYHFYCQRGDSENRIKELKEDLHADRLSCHRFLANQFRLLLHAAAYVLLQVVQDSLASTELARAQVKTIRLKLLKVGARIIQSVRRIAVSVPSAYPYMRLWSRLVPTPFT
jgi:hypothetical protein